MQSRTRLSNFTPLENCVVRGLGGRCGSGKVCCILLVMSVLRSGAAVWEAVPTACRLQANRASNTHPGSAGCLAWPSKPALHSSLPFQVRKKLLRSYSSCAAELGSEPSFPDPRFPQCHATASHSPLLHLLGSSAWSSGLTLRGHISLGFGSYLCQLHPQTFILPAGPPVEQAGHKLSTINKTKTSVLALTLVSWCIFFFFF